MGSSLPLRRSCRWRYGRATLPEPPGTCDGLLRQRAERRRVRADGGGLRRSGSGRRPRTSPSARFHRAGDRHGSGEGPPLAGPPLPPDRLGQFVHLRRPRAGRGPECRRAVARCDHARDRPSLRRDLLEQGPPPPDAGRAGALAAGAAAAAACKDGIALHALWRGDRLEVHQGERFQYYTAQTFAERVGGSFQIVETGTYAEMDDEDSLYVVLRRSVPGRREPFEGEPGAPR